MPDPRVSGLKASFVDHDLYGFDIRSAMLNFLCFFSIAFATIAIALKADFDFASSELLLNDTALTPGPFANPLSRKDGNSPFIVYADGSYCFMSTMWKDVQLTRA